MLVGRAFLGENIPLRAGALFNEGMDGGFILGVRLDGRDP